MAITKKDIISYIVENSTMGYVTIDEVDQLVEMPVVIDYNEDGTANTELHTFRVSAISLVRDEDLTEKRRAAEAVLASL